MLEYETFVMPGLNQHCEERNETSVRSFVIFNFLCNFRCYVVRLGCYDLVVVYNGSDVILGLLDLRVPLEVIEICIAPMSLFLSVTDCQMYRCH